MGIIYCVYMYMTCVGTCEVGGLTPVQALEIVRGCRGLTLVGADLVEVQHVHVYVPIALLSHLLYFSRFYNIIAFMHM